jgi:hypothetical protein
MTKAPAKRPGRTPAPASTAADIAAFLDKARVAPPPDSAGG